MTIETRPNITYVRFGWRRVYRGVELFTRNKIILIRFH